MRDNRPHGNLERERIRQLVEDGRQRGRRQLERSRRAAAHPAGTDAAEAEADTDGTW